MSTYTAELEWRRDGADFASQRYSRRHRLRFDGGAEVAASSSPSIVPEPMSDAAAIDPEEMFVASLASCHMLFFLSIAAARGWCVDRYVDRPVGVMERDGAGRQVMTRVTLRPEVAFGGERVPDAAAIGAMHHRAHVQCFIANSVKTEVLCEPVRPAPAGEGAPAG